MRLAESHPDPWYGRYARHVRLRQGSRALFSPAVRRDPQATLDFGREAAWYLRRVHAQRTQADRNLIERLAAHIALPRALPSARSPVRSISVIPVFALERNLTRSFASYGDEPEGHCFLLWANAAAQHCSRARFEREAARLRDEVERLTRARPGRRIILLTDHFRRSVPVKKLRGLLTDALIVAARRARVDDPVVVYNDADQLAAAPRYLARMVRRFKTEPRLDFVAGPVLFGAAPNGASLLADGERLPELYLGNRFIQAAQAARRAGDGVPPHFITQGANTAFRLAALCAGGGLDYRLWEDAQIGWWSAAMRLGATETPAYQPAHHRFDPELFVATDPRRVLRAILHGRPADQAWDWEAYDHAPITADFAAQRARYRRARSLLQLEEVRRAQGGEAAAMQKLVRRILFNFFRPLHPTSGEWIAAVAKRFGLCFADPVPVASSGTVRVRWRDSAVFDDIFRWASA